MESQANATLPEEGNVKHAISPYYETRMPSAQTAVDVFRGDWKSAFPNEAGVVAGEAWMYEDRRPSWVDNNIPGGLRDRTVLELGPFEGYQTYLLQHLGVSSIVSIEGNSFNFLKCLIVKNTFQMPAHYLLGDFSSHLEGTNHRYDLCWASGILYHQTAPLRLLELISKKSAALYLWTHYYDEELIEALDNVQRAHFIDDGNKPDGVPGFLCTHYMRSYNIDNYSENIPSNWEGGNQGHSYWLRYDDIRAFLEYVGFEHIKADHFSTEISGLPSVSILAWKG